MKLPMKHTYQTLDVIFAFVIIAALVWAGTAAFLLSGKLVYAAVKLFI